MLQLLTFLALTFILLSSSAFGCLHSFLLQTGTHMLVHLIAIPLGSDHGCVLLTCADLTLPTSTSGLHSPRPSTLDLLWCFCKLCQCTTDSHALGSILIHCNCIPYEEAAQLGRWEIVTSGITMTQTFLPLLCVAVIAWYVSRDVLLLDVVSFSHAVLPSVTSDDSSELTGLSICWPQRTLCLSSS